MKLKNQEDVARDDGDYDVTHQLGHVIQNPCVLVLLLLEVLLVWNRKVELLPKKRQNKKVLLNTNFKIIVLFL